CPAPLGISQIVIDIALFCKGQSDESEQKIRERWMITPEYARLFARYNCWQNKSLYDAASALSDDERKAKRGAFFGSIHATLNHLLWGDQIWMSRLAGTP